MAAFSRNQGCNSPQPFYTCALRHALPGSFFMGEMHGTGRLELAGGAGEYDGGFQHNAFHGNGLLRLSDGSVYEGEFRAHKFEGRGRMVAAHGDEYEGEWLAGRRSGQGTRRYANGDVYVVSGAR
jgi:hypothetical protein